MTIEVAPYINGLNAAYPEASSDRATADDHLRLIKAAVKATFPAITGAMTSTHTELNYLAGLTETVGPILKQFSLSISALNTTVDALSAAAATLISDVARISVTVSLLRTDVNSIAAGYVRAASVDRSWKPTKSVTQINSAAYAEIIVAAAAITYVASGQFNIAVDGNVFYTTSDDPTVGGGTGSITLVIPPGAKYWWYGADASLSTWTRFSV